MFSIQRTNGKKVTALLYCRFYDLPQLFTSIASLFLCNCHKYLLQSLYRSYAIATSIYFNHFTVLMQLPPAFSSITLLSLCNCNKYLLQLLYGAPPRTTCTVFNSTHQYTLNSTIVITIIAR